MPPDPGLVWALTEDGNVDMGRYEWRVNQGRFPTNAIEPDSGDTLVTTSLRTARAKEMYGK